MMTELGAVIRRLIDERGKTQKLVANEAEISEVALSNILTGKSRPRQVNLSRLIKVLCESPSDEQVILSAYERSENKLPDVPLHPERPISGDELERTSRYLERKASSIGFRKEVRRLLEGSGIEFEQESEIGPYICDFLVAKEGKHVAIECRFNMNRDWERALASVVLLMKSGRCNSALIVVPYLNQLARQYQLEVQAAGGNVVSLSDLISVLHAIS